MKMSTLKQELRGIEGSILAADQAIKRLEALIAKMGEHDEERPEAERQLASRRSFKNSLEEMRASLLTELERLRHRGDDAA